jgi:hypothetical protein
MFAILNLRPCAQRRKLFGQSVAGPEQGDAKMDSTRRFQKATHHVGGVAEPARRTDTSEHSLTGRPNAQAERVLSIDAVMNDMRAILWPDRCDKGAGD